MDINLRNTMIGAINGIEAIVKDLTTSIMKNEAILEAKTQELINENKKLNEQVTELAKEMKSEKIVDRNNK
tara:strand:+ start:475 stop:687 length:213 start_codon:yes stop_codon:yes gene_type:complete